MESLTVDVQCKQILNGISQLEEYLQEPLAKEALELDANLDTTRNQELLGRLKKSLIQYTERGKNIVYIGFMGHFSTGKSSTINSLLELDENSEDARKIGLHPVDKSITLITHCKNKDSIFNSTKEGLVTIRASFIDSDFLKNIVIADTPGTGDPVLIGEIAKDFLPICDLIIYFFSAANALDNADVPLLKEKYSQLAFIPMRFVVTRADEFKLNHEATFSNENFDRTEAENFLSSLAQRINLLFKDDSSRNGTYIDMENIILIDNKSNFNIELLRQTISKFADISDTQSQINIHSHKVLYFQTSGDKLKSFFCNFLLEKVKVLAEIVKVSECNIERFQNKVQISNHTLTESWNKKAHSINEIKFNINNNIKNPPVIPENISDIVDENENIQILNNLLRTEAFNKVVSLNESIKRDAASQLKSGLTDTRRKINEVSLKNLNSLENLEFKIPTHQKDKLFNNLDIIPSPSLSNEAKKELEEINKKLIDYYQQLRDAVGSLKEQLAKQEPLNQYQYLLNSAASDLANDFDAYFESITVYRSGVFSLGVKEAISKLGLGHQMDQLESEELTDEQKRVRKQEAQEHIFPDRSRSFIDYIKKFSDLHAQCEVLQRNIEALSSEKPTMPEEPPEDWKSSQSNLVKAELVNKFESDIGKLQQNINIKLRELIDGIVGKWEAEVDKIKAERKRRIIFITISFSLVSLMLYLIYISFGQKNLSSNVFMTFIFGLITNLCSSAVGWIVAKSTDNFPKMIRLKESNQLGKLRDGYLQIISDSIENFPNSVNPETKFFYEYWKSFLIRQPTKIWSERGESFYKKLGEYNHQYLKLREEYLETVNECTNTVSNYFSNPHRNLEKLQEFSNELKKTAIVPSFALLANTKDKLETVSKNIQEIKFR